MAVSQACSTSRHRTHAQGGQVAGSAHTATPSFDVRFLVFDDRSRTCSPSVGCSVTSARSRPGVALDLVPGPTLREGAEGVATPGSAVPPTTTPVAARVGVGQAVITPDNQTKHRDLSRPLQPWVVPNSVKSSAT